MNECYIIFYKRAARAAKKKLKIHEMQMIEDK